MANGFGVNIAALKVSGRLNDTARTQQTVMERLGSGMRINHASDDAAGLSISLSLRADTRIYGQAIRNVNDGVSAITLATSALVQLTAIVTRQIELAEQAANGTYTAKQRVALDKEASALTDEYNRIGSTVSFNGINVLTSVANIQAGVGTDAVLTVDAGSLLADEIGTGVFTTATTTSSSSSVSRQLASGDLNGDGHDDIITGNWTDNNISVMISNGDGTFAAPVQYSVGGNASLIKLEDLNHDGIKDVVTRGASAGNSTVAVLLGNSNGTFRSAQHYSVGTTVFYDFELADFNNDGNLDFVGSHQQLGIGNGIAVYLGRSDGSFGSMTTIGTYRAGDFHAGDFNGDNNLDFVTYDSSGGSTRVFLGNGDGTFSTTVPSANSNTAVFDVNRDGYSDLIKYNNATTLGVLYGSATGTFSTGGTISLTTGGSYLLKTLDANEDGYNDIVAFSDSSTTANIIFGCGNGTFSAAQALTFQLNTFDVAVGDVTGDGARDIISASLNASGIQIIQQTGIRAVNQAHLNLLSMSDARSSLDSLRTQLQTLSRQSAMIGAQESRLNTVSNVLQSLRENYTTAESRIMDADVAHEMAQLVRTNIIMQVASSIMAQAKNSQSFLLELLRS